MSSPSTLLLSFLGILESSSAFLSGKLFGISWDSKAVLNGSASREDTLKFLACTLIMCHSLTYYAVNLMYEFVRAVFTPKQLVPWRAHGEKYASRSQINKCIAYTAVFHVATAYISYQFLVPFLYDKGIFAGPGYNIIQNLPSNGFVFLGQLVLCLASTEVFFTLGHRALHEIPFAYEYIHKKHHEFIITESWACEYAHPIELIFGNILPVLAGPMLFRLNPLVWFTWMILAINGTCQGHSSFFYPSKKMYFHVFHHSANKGNFGSTGLLDKLMGTDALWEEHRKLAKGNLTDIFKITPQELIKYRQSVRKQEDAEKEVIARASAVVLGQKGQKEEAKKKTPAKRSRSSSSSASSPKKKKNSTSSSPRGRSSSSSSRKKK